MRMFVAAVPPAATLDALESFLEPRRAADDNLRWTDGYQWHVTLAFYAQVPERRVEELTERLTRAAARRRPVRLRLTGAGAFPSPTRAKVVWLGVEAEPLDGLSRLAEGARAAATRAGIEVEGGRFRPHLTLARLRQPVNVSRWLRIVEAFEAAPWELTRIELIASHLGEGPNNKPRYQPVETFPVGTSAEGDVDDQGV